MAMVVERQAASAASFVEENIRVGRSHGMGLGSVSRLLNASPVRSAMGVLELGRGPLLILAIPIWHLIICHRSVTHHSTSFITQDA
jgi:hypothetical protein